MDEFLFILCNRNNSKAFSFLYRYRYRSITFLFVTVRSLAVPSKFLIVSGPFPHRSGLKKAKYRQTLPLPLLLINYLYLKIYWLKSKTVFCIGISIQFWVTWIFDRYDWKEIIFSIFTKNHVYFIVISVRSRIGQKNIGHDERTARNGTGTVQEQKNYCIDYFIFINVAKVSKVIYEIYVDWMFRQKSKTLLKYWKLNSNNKTTTTTTTT